MSSTSIELIIAIVIAGIVLVVEPKSSNIILPAIAILALFLFFSFNPSLM